MTPPAPTTDEITLIERTDPDRAWVALLNGRRWCRIHALVFETTGVYALAPNTEAHGICSECTRAPKRPSTIAIQEWWRPATFGTPHRMVLRCEDHGLMFETEEMCRVCASAEETNDG